MARQTRTPADKAAEAYGIAYRAHEKATSRLDDAKAAITSLETMAETTKRRLDHARTDPDLPLSVIRETEGDQAEVDPDQATIDDALAGDPDPKG